MIPLLLIVVAAASYALGCLSSGRLLAQYALKRPIRKSGYVSFAVFDRMFGRKWAVALAALDVAKAAVAALFGSLLLRIPGDGFPVIGALFAGFCVVLGDIHPWQYRFRGGKGVLPLMTALWIADWRLGLSAALAFFVVVALSQYVSAASLAAAFVAPVSAWIVVEPEQLKGSAGVVLLVAFFFILWRYRGSVLRLIDPNARAQEPKVRWGRPAESRLGDEDF